MNHQHGIYIPVDNLCNSSSPLGNWPPPLINPHRKDAFVMTNLPMLVYHSPLAGLMVNFTVYCERMRSSKSWWSSKLCSSRTIMVATCAWLHTSIFFLLHVSPHFLSTLFSVSCPFQNIDFEVIPLSFGCTWSPSLTVERSDRFYMVSKFSSDISSYECSYHVWLSSWS